MKKLKTYYAILVLILAVLILSLLLSGKNLKLTPSYKLPGQNGPSFFLGDEKPNIVLVTIDTLRADHLRCYGYPKNISPNIDQLANQGVLFFNTISQASITPVSHASILTGLYPYHHGLRYLHGGNHFKLQDTVTTLAEMLQEEEYKTAAFISAFPLISTRYNLSQGFAYYDEDFSIDKNTTDCPLCLLKGLFNTGKSQRRADQTNSKVFQWLEKNYKERFFIWVHYFDPHDPILVPPQEFTQLFPRIEPQEKNSIALYDMEIAYTDYQFGELWQKIQALGLDDNTLFILTSDHGQGLHDHSYWSHGEKLYQEQIHVPLIMRYAKLGQGKKISALTRTVDIVPTVIEMVNIPLNKHPVDGTSLLPYILGDQSLPELIAYSETHYPKILDNDSPLFSVIDQPWKFIYSSEKEDMSQLFNLNNDPMESSNVAQTHPALIQKFKNYLQKQNVFVQETLIPKTGSIEADVLEKLKSLGYLAEPEGPEQ